MQAWDYDVATPEDAHGWVGERYDATTGLQYLNARYYDVRLGMFIQPDWFEVTEPGVGTNRYAWTNWRTTKIWLLGKEKVMTEKNNEYSDVLYALGLALVEIRASNNIEMAGFLAEVFHNVPAKVNAGFSAQEIEEEVMSKAKRLKLERLVGSFFRDAKKFS